VDKSESEVYLELLVLLQYLVQVEESVYHGSGILSYWANNRLSKDKKLLIL